MTSDNALQLDYDRIGRNGRVQVTARLGDTILYVDKLDVTSAKGR